MYARVSVKCAGVNFFATVHTLYTLVAHVKQPVVCRPGQALEFFVMHMRRVCTSMSHINYALRMRSRTLKKLTILQALHVLFTAALSHGKCHTALLHRR